MNSHRPKNPLGHHRAGQHRQGLRRRRRPFAHRHAGGHRRRAIPSKPGLAENFPGARILDGYDALLADPEVDAVYIATPHPGHAEWAIKAAEAGKHVLVEKPMALSAFEADAMFHAARKAGTFLGEAFMYRLHPQTREAGRTGQVRRHRRSPDDPVELRLRHAGLHAGAPALRQRSRRRRHPRCRRLSGLDGAPDRRRRGRQAVRRSGQGRRRGASRPVAASTNGPRRVLHFPERHRRRGLLRDLAQPGQRAAHPRHRRAASRCRTSGSPAATATAASARSTIIRSDGKRETVERQRRRASSIPSRPMPPARRSAPAGRNSPAPGMSWADSLGNLRVLDKWRARCGLEYEIEKAGKPRQHDLRPARCGADGTAIPQARDPGPRQAGVASWRSASRISATFSSGSILLDAFFEAGGNLFDTGLRLWRRLHRDAVRRMA